MKEILFTQKEIQEIATITKSKIIITLFLTFLTGLGLGTILNL